MLWHAWPRLQCLALKINIKINMALARTNACHSWKDQAQTKRKWDKIKPTTLADINERMIHVTVRVLRCVYIICTGIHKGKLSPPPPNQTMVALVLPPAVGCGSCWLWWAGGWGGEEPGASGAGGPYHGGLGHRSWELRHIFFYIRCAIYSMSCVGNVSLASARSMCRILST